MKWLADILKWIEPLRAQYAIKLTLASLLTYYLALWLRLDEPGWGVATCIVLAMAKHVGAIGEKAILRTLGNFTGGALAVLLLGNFAENEWLLLGSFFLITAFCSWRYGGTSHPYVYLLAALTLNIILIPNYNTPGQVWESAVNRVLEVTLGIMVSTVIYSVLWPRYARVEFLNEIRSSFADLSQALSGPAVPGSNARLIQQNNARLTKLRKLLDSGARESAYFRHHFEVYAELTNKINSLYLFAGKALREAQEFSAEDPAERLIERLNQLAGQRLVAIETGQRDVSRQLRQEFHHGLQTLRSELLLRLPRKDARTAHFASVYLTLKRLHSQLRQVGELYDFLERNPTRVLRFPFLPRTKTPGYPTDPYWIRIAIKSTTAACLAWLLCNWLQPPGGTLIPYIVWYYTLMSRQFNESYGDRGVFQFAFVTSLLAVPYFIFAFLVTPMLASYAVMNVALGATLLIFGYLTANLAGWSRFSRLAFFIILGMLDLNPQSPVSAQAIIGSYLAIAIAIGFAAIVDRLWWPILPHWEICSRLAGYFAHGARYLRNPDSPDRIRWLQQMGLLANETGAWASQLRTAAFPVEETTRWDHVLASLRLASYRLRLLVFLARRHRAILHDAERAVALFHQELQHYYGEWHQLFQKRGALPVPSLAPLEQAYTALETLAPDTGNPTQDLVFAGMKASAFQLIEALRQFDSEIRLIPLADYRLDRSL